MSYDNTKKSKKPARLVRSEEYKTEAVKLANTVGVTEAARQLKIHRTQLYTGATNLESKKPALRLRNDSLKKMQGSRVSWLKRSRRTIF